MFKVLGSTEEDCSRFKVLGSTGEDRSMFNVLSSMLLGDVVAVIGGSFEQV